MNSVRITEGARALCGAYSRDTEVDFESSWEKHKDLFLADASTVIKAADFGQEKSQGYLRRQIEQHKSNEDELIRKNWELEATLLLYRQKFGVLGLVELGPPR